jgi:hypothetical protein
MLLFDFPVSAQHVHLKKNCNAHAIIFGMYTQYPNLFTLQKYNDKFKCRSGPRATDPFQHANFVLFFVVVKNQNSQCFKFKCYPPMELDSR